MGLLYTDRQLNGIRAMFDRSLTIPCSIWRGNVDAEGVSLGSLDFVGNTRMGVNLSGSGSTSPFINSLARLLQVKSPGQRTLSFTWDEDIETGDIVFEEAASLDEAGEALRPANSVPRYRCAVVNNDDERRYGLQVTAERMGQK